ncbi:MAG: hypothetical protein LQ340_000755 [Diploschistes diacapsis]|nr:MAG: hypothetical protein LQ340_000755 [Diploschistes diacapsis]
MPRDLFPQKSPSDLILTASPEMKSPSNRSDSDEPEETRNENWIFRDERDQLEVGLSAKMKANDDLHPHFIYRLTTCPSLSLGLYSSTTASPNPSTQATHDAARTPDSQKPAHKSLLMGQVIATLTTASTITERSMDYPRSFPSHPDYTASNTDAASSNTAAPSFTPSTSKETNKRPDILHREPTESLPDSSFPRMDQSDSEPGHHPLGRTLAIHSVCVHPAFQKLGLGKTLLKAYLQRMEGSGIADRAAIIVRPEKVGWYVGAFGFQDRGNSTCGWAGGGWRDLVYDFKDSTLWA